MISAEVQQVGTYDGKISLQTRNEKYGKLKNGMFLKVDNNFVRKMKNHVLEFFYEPEIGCILGTNGYIWIHSMRSADQQVTLVERTRMAALRNAIVALEKQKVPI